MSEQESAPEGIEFIDKFSIEDLVEIISKRCDSFVFCCRPTAPLEKQEDPDHIMKFDGYEALKLNSMLNYVITEEMKLDAQYCATDWISIQRHFASNEDDEEEAFN